MSLLHSDHPSATSYGEKLFDNLKLSICNFFGLKTITNQRCDLLHQQLLMQAAQLKTLESQPAAFRCDRDGLDHDKVAAQHKCAERSEQLEPLESNFHHVIQQYLRYRRS